MVGHGGLFVRLHHTRQPEWQQLAFQATGPVRVSLLLLPACANHCHHRGTRTLLTPLKCAFSELLLAHAADFKYESSSFSASFCNQNKIE